MADSTRVRRAPGVVFQNLGDEDGAVLLNVETGVYHGLNPVGARIWEFLESSSSEEDLTRRVAEEFGVEESVAEPDVRAFIDGLSTRKLVRREPVD